MHRREVIERLKTERRHAEAAFEYARVNEIDQQIQQIEAAGQPVNPQKETTAAVSPKRETTAAGRPKSRRKT